MGKNTSKENAKIVTAEEQRDLLKDWTYVREYLLANFDPHLIEEHARALLSRALNIGRVVAFVSSGISVCYGRIGWSELVRAEQERISRRYEKHELRLAGSRARQLKDLLDKLKDPGHLVASDRYPMIAQVCEQLDMAIAEVLGDKKPTLREHVDYMLFDDRGHARQLIYAARIDHPDLTPQDEQKRDADLDKIFQNADSIARNRTLHAEEAKLRADARHLQLFKRDALRELLKGGQFSGIAKGVKDAMSTLASGQGYLQPTHRFVTAAALRLLTDAQQKAWLAHHRGRKAEPRPRREELVPLALDPLRTLTRDLGIRRFLTTNYDLDIERLFADMGYKVERPPASQETRESGTAPPIVSMDPLGALSRDFVFTADRAGDLVNFASHEEGGPLQLVHLHGRSTADADTILTERDYQRLYLSDEDGRDLIDASISLTFSANHVLFVGNGMSEDDILRPLRRFMSERRRRDDRTAIALMPDLRGETCVIEDKITYLGRFGVYSIFYGRAKLPKGVWDAKHSGASWLADVRNVVFKLRDALTNVIEKRPGLAPAEAAEYVRSNWSTYELPAPTTLEDQCCKTSPYNVDFEMKLLNACIAFCKTAKKRGPNYLREARFYRAVLEGLPVAIQTALFNAKLQSIKKDWGSWAQSWLAIPEPRAPQLAKLPDVKSGDPAIYVRHRIELAGSVDTGGDAKFYQRFFQKGGAQTFDALLSSLREYGRERSRKTVEWAGRRLFLFVSRRGVGKGHFFSTLPGRLSAFIDASWRNDGRPPAYDSAAFFNLSFSLEVSTVFDQLTDLLWARFESVFADVNGSLRKQIDALEDKNESNKSRVDSLRHALAAYEKAMTHNPLNGAQRRERPPPKRILLAFNGVDILFDDRGWPKNGQLAMIFNLLVGDEFKNAPIDFVFVCGEGAIPAHFRKPDRSDAFEKIVTSYPDTTFVKRVEHPLAIITRKNIPPSTRDEVASRIAGHRLNAEWPERQERQEQCTDEQWCVVHYLRPAHTSLLACAYFPALASVWMANLRDTTGAYAYGQLADRFELRASGKAHPTAGLVSKLMDTYEKGREEPDEKQAYRTQMPLFVALSTTGRLNSPDLEKHAETAKAIADKLVGATEIANRISDFEKEERDVGVKLKANAALKGQVEHCRATADFCLKMRSVAETLDHSRLATTILLAAAEERVRHEVLGDPTRERISAAGPNWIDTVLQKVRQRNARSRTDVVIESALDSFADLHAQGSELPLKLDHIDGRKHGRLIDALLRRIMWHLAVMGQPIEASVLQHCPDFDDLFNAFEVVATPAKQAVIDDALRLLVHRCLVFEIDNRRLDQNRHLRYALHRSIQRFVFRKMNAPLTEYSRIDQFTMTMYATQPSELPRPESETHNKVARTTARLSRYPLGGRQLPLPKPKEDGERWAAARLRAAYGCFRSIYSIAVVSRLAEYGHPADEIEHGHFEEHRLQIRWLIKMANRVTQPTAEGPPLGAEQSAKSRLSPEHAPFYKEELVWLYNECGLLSFIQGKLNDALGLFRQALRASERIESKHAVGPIRARVGLNLAVVEIERGNFVVAESLLVPIVALSHEHPVARLVAYGFIGLIDQLRGNNDQAKEKLERAYKSLADLERWRGAAIFGRHYGDVLRMLGRQHYVESETVLRQALNFSDRGGQEDIRQLVRMSLARLSLADEQRSEQKFRALGVELDDIERYGRIMGTPRLLCEVAAFRAKMLLGIGETRLAGTFAAKSLELATINGMTLRKVTAMMLLAQTYIQRKEGERAWPILIRALEIAQKTGYHNLISTAEQLLSTSGERRPSAPSAGGTARTPR